MRYGYRLGCRFGQPHKLKIIHENPHVKWEACEICGKRFRWNKGYKGRVNNVEYLKAHVRNFAQKFGATKRVYHKIYSPKKTIIKI
jgi:hypothetical protein